MLESLILHHHANGFEKVVIYFDCPDDPGEQEARLPKSRTRLVLLDSAVTIPPCADSQAIAAVEQFAKPLPTGPVPHL